MADSGREPRFERREIGEEVVVGRDPQEVGELRVASRIRVTPEVGILLQVAVLPRHRDDDDCTDDGGERESR